MWEEDENGNFHSLPFRCSRDILNQWLIVLQIDINTLIELLGNKDYLVRRDHFDHDDFTMTPTLGKPKKPFLRKNAIPRAVQVAAERVEVMHIWLYSTKLFVIQRLEIGHGI